MSDGGKGDKQRPTNHKTFSENFDRIFGTKKRLRDMTEEDFDAALGIEHERSGTMEDPKSTGESNGTPNLPCDPPERRDASC